MGLLAPAVLSMVALCTISAPALARGMATDTAITFEDAGAGVTLSTQYAAQGVTFGSDPTAYGIPNGGASMTCADPVTKTVAASSGHSGTIAIVGGDCPYGEFPSAGNVFMIFSQLRSSVSIKVLDSGVNLGVTYSIVGYDAFGNQVAENDQAGQSSATVLTLHMTTTTAQIAYAVVVEPKFDTDRFDDLSFDNPAVEPDIAPAFQTAAVLAQGLSVSGLPSGVTYSISPNPVTGTNSSATLSLTASSTATVGKATVTITATPDTLAAGSQPRSIQRTVQVNAPYELPSETHFVAPCTTYTFPIKVVPSTTFNQSVSLAVGPGTNAPAGLAVSVSPGIVNASNAWSAKVTVTPPSTMSVPLNPLTSGPAFHIDVTGASSGVPDQHASWTMWPYAGNVVAATRPNSNPNQFSTPSVATYAKVSDQFIVKGEGFCPGMKVQFGNAEAKAPATSSPARDILTGTVPELATSGKLSVLTPNGATLKLGPNVTVSSLRNTFGFAFVNAGSDSPGFQDAVDETAKRVGIKGEPTLVKPEKERRSLYDILFNDASDLIPDRAKMLENHPGFYYMWR